ncbi:hypothetical protein GCM10010388_68040 [Streptomyces mauvecolor]
MPRPCDSCPVRAWAEGAAAAPATTGPPSSRPQHRTHTPARRAARYLRAVRDDADGDGSGDAQIPMRSSNWVWNKACSDSCVTAVHALVQSPDATWGPPPPAPPSRRHTGR